MLAALFANARVKLRPLLPFGGLAALFPNLRIEGWPVLGLHRFAPLLPNPSIELWTVFIAHGLPPVFRLGGTRLWSPFASGHACFRLSLWVITTRFSLSFQSERKHGTRTALQVPLLRSKPARIIPVLGLGISVQKIKTFVKNSERPKALEFHFSRTDIPSCYHVNTWLRLGSSSVAGTRVVWYLLRSLGNWVGRRRDVWRRAGPCPLSRRRSLVKLVKLSGAARPHSVTRDGRCDQARIGACNTRQARNDTPRLASGS